MQDFITITRADQFQDPSDELEQLTPKEREQERKARLEEMQKRAWMDQSPQQLARRIPVSVFAMAGVAADD
ncbi:MAG TPA: hypothetical protein VEA40_00825 [Ramlibacter sp.]|nr:hypothetical protein [Ramlibacter sp.]